MPIRSLLPHVTTMGSPVDAAKMRGCVLTATDDGLITEVQSGIANSGEARAAIYSVGEVLLGSSASTVVTVSGNEYRSIPLSTPVAIVQAVQYMIGVQGDDWNTITKANGTSSYWEAVFTYGSSLPDPVSATYNSYSDMAVSGRGWIAPTITNFNGGAQITDGDLAVPVVGSDFMPTQGTGKFWLTDNATWGSETGKTEQTIDSWGDTLPYLDIVQGALVAGSVYLHCVTDLGLVTAAGFSITLAGGSSVTTSTTEASSGGSLSDHDSVTSTVATSEAESAGTYAISYNSTADVSVTTAGSGGSEAVADAVEVVPGTTTATTAANSGGSESVSDITISIPSVSELASGGSYATDGAVIAVSSVESAGTGGSSADDSATVTTVSISIPVSGGAAADSDAIQTTPGITQETTDALSGGSAAASDFVVSIVVTTESNSGGTLSQSDAVELSVTTTLLSSGGSEAEADATEVVPGVTTETTEADSGGSGADSDAIVVTISTSEILSGGAFATESSDIVIGVTRSTTSAKSGASIAAGDAVLSVVCTSAVSSGGSLASADSSVSGQITTTVYSSAIAMALRLITKKGQAVTWRTLRDGAPDDVDKPWIPGAAITVDYPVPILFLENTKENRRTFGHVTDSNVVWGNEIGLMPAVDFDPRIKDIIIRSGVENVVRTMSILRPNGEPILYTFELVT